MNFLGPWGPFAGMVLIEVITTFGRGSYSGSDSEKRRKRKRGPGGARGGPGGCPGGPWGGPGRALGFRGGHGGGLRSYWIYIYIYIPNLIYIYIYIYIPLVERLPPAGRLPQKLPFLENQNNTFLVRND